VNAEQVTTLCFAAALPADQNFWDDAFYSSITGRVLRPQLVDVCMPDTVTLNGQVSYGQGPSISTSHTPMTYTQQAPAYPHARHSDSERPG
jgi:hypothetical protein